MPIESATDRTIFLEAVQYVPPERWDAFVKDRCGGDLKLYERVHRLLVAHQDLGDFHESDSVPTVVETTETACVASLDTQIGPYKLREKIGEGGMGEVYVAEQTQPVRRKVALKIIKPGMASKDVLARFEAERQALALMDHPNIASVLDGGAAESGQPFFVMELVRGVPFTEFCDRERLSTTERLQLFLKVCRAVQHAHQKGIIHRDIKPTNVLVSEIDGEAVPRVIDFGVAKAVSQKLTDHTVYTQFEQVVGTPLYMSPEQAGTGIIDIDTRSDVYSLGVLLYELLTGNTPFDREILKQSGFDEFRRILREEEPRRPSQAISTLNAEAMSTISERRACDPRKLTQAVRGELDWIVMKALEKDRTRRYETANGLARDIERYLSSEPVEACPPAVGYRLRKYAERHKVLLSAGILVTASLFLGLSASLWYAVKANRSALQAQMEKGRAEENLQTAIDALDKVYLEAIGDDRAFAHIAPESRTQPLTEREKDLIRAGLVFYERLAQLNGDDADIRHKSGEAMLRTGELRSRLGEHDEAVRAFDKAIERFQELVSQSPDEPRYTLGLARAKTGMALQVSNASDSGTRRDDLLNSALEAWNHHLELKPQAAAIDFVARANVYRALGKLRMAQKDFERAIEIEPDNAQHYVSLGQTLINQGGLDNRAKMIEFMETAVRLAPDNAQVRLSLSTGLMKRGRHQERREQLLKALELDPNSSQVHAALAEYYEDSGELCAALEHANRAIELKPTNHYPYKIRAGIRIRLTQLDEALKDLNHSLELKPAVGHVRALRADVLCRLQRYGEAERDYDAAIADGPSQWHIYKRRAALRYKFGRYEEALEDLRTVVENGPAEASNLLWIPLDALSECPDETFRRGVLDLADMAVEKCKARDGSWQLQRAYRVRGILKVYLDEAQGVQSDLAKAYEMAGGIYRPGELNTIAWYLVRRPDTDDALLEQAANWATEATQLRPDDPNILNTAGVARYRVKDYVMATENLSKSMNLDGSLPHNGFFLAMAHWQLGNKDQAREWYDRSVKWMKNNNSADEELIRFRDEAEETLGIKTETEDASEDAHPTEEESPSESPEELKAIERQKERQ